ncbi:hypothetical protein GCM10023213_12150 [Prosthecobacter algae]|uniref:HEAT repeat protein n=1 Tax=Prosthecobacter algae TaxID=1144682 RepID=A0ABP9NYG0_9BACT
MIRLFFLVLGLLSPQLWGQSRNEEPNASASFHGGVGNPIPNVELPKQVVAAEGELTLYADFSQTSEKANLLFLVNRSEASVTFESQDGDIYIKLEHELPDGRWQRAQAHQSSWCGNSYGVRVLPPGQHFKLSGYRAQKGHSARVRYACYGSVEVISNTGKGLYAPADVEAANKDGITWRGTPQELYRHLDLDTLNSDHPDEVFRQELGIASLELLRVLGGPGTQSPKRKAEEWVARQSAKQSLTDDESKALASIKAVLARPWMEEMDWERLLNHCFQALIKPPSEPSIFGSPESIPHLLWQAMAALAEPARTGYALPKPVSNASLKPVLEMAANRLMTAPEAEQEAMLRILTAQAPLADECLGDAIFESYLASSNKAVVRAGAQALSRRSRWQKLVEQAWKLSSDSQIIVLNALLRAEEAENRRGMDGHGGLRDPDRETDEGLFWKHCLRTCPVQCAVIWQQLSTRSAYLPYLPYLKQQLLPVIKAKADERDQKTDEFEMKSDDSIGIILSLLAPPADNFKLLEEGISQADLITQLNRLLKHPGYVKQRGFNHSGGSSVEYERRHFLIRDEASQALKRLQQSVPENLVTERIVTPTQTSPNAGQRGNDPFR